MLTGRVADVRLCVLTSRWLPAAVVLLLLLSSSLSRAHSTTVEHEFHIVHNVDNRSKTSPLPDKYWQLMFSDWNFGQSTKTSGVFYSVCNKMADIVFQNWVFFDVLVGNLPRHSISALKHKIYYFDFFLIPILCNNVFFTPQAKS